jgi:hypothetical protein
MGKLFGTDGLRAKAGEFPLEKGAVYAGQLAVFLKKEARARIIVGAIQGIGPGWKNILLPVLLRVAARRFQLE